MLWSDTAGSLCPIAGIPCEPPPNIPHGKHTGRLLDEFLYGTSITYSCEPGYPLRGAASIFCTTHDGKNGVWSGPPPLCGGRVHGEQVGVPGCSSSSQTALCLERQGDLKMVACIVWVPAGQGLLLWGGNCGFGVGFVALGQDVLLCFGAKFAAFGAGAGRML